VKADARTTAPHQGMLASADTVLVLCLISCVPEHNNIHMHINHILHPLHSIA
jgi:hypothetical protein